MASLFDLFFDNNNSYYRKPQYVDRSPYRYYNNYYDSYNNNNNNNYYDIYDNYNHKDNYDSYINQYNKYNNHINNKHNKSYHNSNNSNNSNNNKVNINKNNNNNNNNSNIKSEFSIKETNDSIIIETSLPNVDRNDIQIEIRDSKLIIQGEKKPSKEFKVEQPIIEQPSIEEYEEDKEEDKGKAVVYKYITIKTQPKQQLKQQPQQLDTSFGPFNKSLDLTNILPYLNLRNINSTFNNNILSIRISKLNLNNNYRVKIF